MSVEVLPFVSVECIHAPQTDIFFLGVFRLLVASSIQCNERHRPFQQFLVLCQTEGTKLQCCRINLQFSVIKPEIVMVGLPVFGITCSSL